MVLLLFDELVFFQNHEVLSLFNCICLLPYWLNYRFQMIIKEAKKGTCLMSDFELLKGNYLKNENDHRLKRQLGSGLEVKTLAF